MRTQPLASYAGLGLCVFFKENCMLISKKLKQIYEVIASDKAPFICHAAADLCEEDRKSVV